jgi:hypothetical protein
MRKCGSLGETSSIFDGRGICIIFYGFYNPLQHYDLIFSLRIKFVRKLIGNYEKE